MCQPALTPPAVSEPSSSYVSSSELRARKRQRTTKAPKQQEQVASNPLRKYIENDTHVFRTLGWEETIRRRRGRGNFGDLNIRHPAKRLLHYLGHHGAPVVFTTPPWDHQRIYAAAIRGPHKSAYEHQDFLRDEMAEMILRRQWIVLPYNDIKDLPGLQLSPIGVVPQ